MNWGNFIKAQFKNIFRLFKQYLPNLVAKKDLLIKKEER